MTARVWTAVAVACSASLAAAQPILGVGGFGPFSTQSLYSIDPGTGQATLIGDTGLTQISDIAWYAPSATLFAFTAGADVYGVDINTGASALIASRTAILPEGGVTFGDVGTFGPYRAFATDGADLVRINTNDASSTTVGAHAALDISGLAFHTGSLYGVALNAGGNDELLSIDPLTGAASVVGLTGTAATSVAGLASDGATLYLTDGNALHTLNTATGAATLVGNHGTGGFSGIAVIPAPASGLALLGLALVARRRR